MKIRCDIFCTVVDNFGDAGVCWRLARQLVREHGWDVRLWIDDMATLARLVPAYDAACDEQRVDGVVARRWPPAFPAVEPADIVVEAFACELPPTYVEAMAARPQPPVWINLEYLSAEDWVAGCHGQASPHPRLPLVKHFFFPGFVPGTGGLIRERDADFSPGPPKLALNVSMFCYTNPALLSLLDAWSAGGEPLRCLVADGLPRTQIERWLGEPFVPGITTRREALELVALPFVAQTAYDRLLAECDLNFVRGEDSLVRAQWAMHPFVWQVYPQAEAAHRPKLAAFLACYGAHLPPDTAVAVADFWNAWNGDDDLAARWPAFRRALPRLAKHAQPWSEQLAALGELAGNLAKFALQRL